MPTSRAARRVLASSGVALLLVGCALPMQDSTRESPYTGGYGGAGGGGRPRDEYRGPLPAGTYTESCRDMRVDRDRRRLEAECLGRDGRWRDTSLDLRDCDRGIMNADGRLVCPRQETLRLPAGSYRESCRDFSVDEKRLGARCRRLNGEWRDTEIDLSRCKSPIRNDDGRLVCG
jgi:CVNH domain-containing protein